MNDIKLLYLAHSALIWAIQKCYELDKLLIDRDMERSSVARIFYYMQEFINHDNYFEKLRKYNIDLEYNKNGEHKKMTPRFQDGIQPDLLVHIRGKNEGNLLAVEFKSGSGNLDNMPEYGNSPRDFVKLEDLTKIDIYNYALGIFVRLNHKNPECTYFANGQKTSKQEFFHE